MSKPFKATKKTDNGRLALPLRILLAAVHAGSWMTGRPLRRMRWRMSLFMKAMDAAACLKLPGQRVEWGDLQAQSRSGRPIPLRWYRPVAPESGATGPLPVILYFHGGGFALGDHRVRHRYNQAWAALSGCLFLSVGYRLAPEHPYPHGADDAYEALLWAAEEAGRLGGDPARLAVAGESAGGNIAAVTALRAARSGGPPLKGQALLYPAVDLTGGSGSTDAEQPSLRQNGRQYMLTLQLLQQFANGYAPPELRVEPEVSPLLAEQLGGLPPALVVTAELDPLRDQGHQYAERLRAAGIPTEYCCYGGMIHDFTAMMPGWLPEAEHSLRLCADFLKERLQEEAAVTETDWTAGMIGSVTPQDSSSIGSELQ
ncbi:alpha/beta hydrolase [Paenibacillus pasadenensis]|uniref:alpha/beta hydrolase n=1 Tax=Paenibacillus pasadenensis TaxID=217090 RepID=UPI0020424FB2|nr:alpha/beta hydrolase [Paenibacillus pasadenensis]